jgi:hypothetical protein
LFDQLLHALIVFKERAKTARFFAHARSLLFPQVGCEAILTRGIAGQEE